MPVPALSAPFTPPVLLRPLLRALPHSAANRFLNHSLRQLHRAHPGIAQRLQPIAGKTFLISPLEFPFAIVSRVTSTGRMEALAVTGDTSADVFITGTLASLVDMLEGKCDGDALFFSRELKVQGNTEALLTLRNALDSEAVRLVDILVPEPLQPVAQRLHPLLQKIFSTMADDMRFMTQAIRGDLEKRTQASDEKYRHLQNQLEQNKLALKQQEMRLYRLDKRANHGSA